MPGFSLARFSISHTTGFVPSQLPAKRLPELYEPWEVLIDQLPALLQQQALRAAVLELPILEASVEGLLSENDWRRAYVVLSFLLQGYLWTEGEKGVPSVVPRVLAVPLWAVCQHLGLPPVLTYASSALYNWRKVDEGKGLEPNNLSTVTFSGTRDEEWFYIVSLLVEMAAAPGLVAMVEVLRGVESKDNKTVIKNLKVVNSSLEKMIIAFNRMPEQCKPEAFHNFRRYQAGSMALEDLPQGIIYEGVDEKPMKFCGASAGQSPLLATFDIFLGVEHSGDALEFLQQQRMHMAPIQREFLEAFKEQVSLKEFVQASSDRELQSGYDVVVNGLEAFRNEHLRVVGRYIVSQNKMGQENKSLRTKGTGGSSFLQLLKNVTLAVRNCSLHKR